MSNELYGVWHVTTEGDCEGKSTKDLGQHEGWVDEIAFSLANKVYYSLSFKRVAPLDVQTSTPKREKVIISLPYDLGNTTVSNVKKLLGDRTESVDVVDCSYYNSVELVNKNWAEEQRKQALAKLTKEERKILGLEE